MKRNEHLFDSEIGFSYLETKTLESLWDDNTLNFDYEVITYVGGYNLIRLYYSDPAFLFMLGILIERNRK